MQHILKNIVDFLLTQIYNRTFQVFFFTCIRVCERRSFEGYLDF